VVSFFEQGGQFVRCETRELPDGTFELSVTDPDGKERVERFASAHALDARLAELEASFRTSGWFGPYGRRS
jgi:hypothetical protein